MSRGAFALLVLAACASGREPPPAQHTVLPERSAPAFVPGAPSSAPAARAHHVRITGVEGGAAAGLAVGRAFAPGELFAVPAGLRVSLALDDFVALRIGGPGLVSWLPDGEPALLVREGTLTVDCAPRGVRATSAALWLATPVAWVEVADAARFVLRAYPEGASALAVVSGQVRVSQRDGEPVAVAAGTARCLSDGAARPWPSRVPSSRSDLEAVERALAGRTRCAPAAVAALEPALEATSAAVQAAHEREQALLAEHTRRLATGDTGTDAVRRELAMTAAQLHLGRERVRGLRAQLEARLLGQAPTTAQSALLARIPRR